MKFEDTIKGIKLGLINGKVRIVGINGACKAKDFKKVEE